MKTLVAVAILAMVIVPPALAKAKRAQSARPQQGYQSSERPGYYHGYPLSDWYRASSNRLKPPASARWGDAARFQAKPTQWFDHELMCSAALPARGAIPAMNFRTMRHRGSMPDKRAFVRDARHGFLHFRKKPFVAKVARCDLSTVQVLERACL